MHYAKLVSGIGGAVLVAWSLLGRADEALISRLDTKFATKEDVIRVEAKLDVVVNMLKDSRNMSSQGLPK